MKIDENWFKLYELMYGEKFNRLLTVGNNEKGYVNYTIQNLEELKNLLNEFSNSEFYISLYNYKTEENILRWNTNDLNNFEQTAEKKFIMFRFRQNIDIIQEEIISLSEIQKFMFIRRSLNLGFNKEIIAETKKTYNFFKTHFNLKGLPIYNGYNEILLIYPKEELNIKNPSLTYYNLLKLIKEKLELNTLLYENIEPYAQLIPLPGTQNEHSRLYVQIFYPDFTYEEIINISQNKYFDTEHLKKPETSEKFHEFLISIDDEINNNERNSRYDFEEIWNNI